MNGKITLTVDMEKVPHEISRILSDLSTRLDTLNAQTRDLVGSANHLETLNKIDEIRKKLSLIDFNYEDCYAILVGYMKYQADKRLAEMKSQEQNKNDK